jgi:hypothetical protein
MYKCRGERGYPCAEEVFRSEGASFNVAADSIR